MSLHGRYRLTRVINARGTYTPLGVSRSDDVVASTVADALKDFFVIDELQAVASAAIARSTGAEAAAVTHCVAAAVTLAVAAAMTREVPERIAALPDATGMPYRVVLPAGHAVDYGHPLVTDIRLAGGKPVLAGRDDHCTITDLEQALAQPAVACLLLLSSRLTRGQPIDPTEAVAAAHRRGVPAIIDGAAQDMRIPELLATGADLVLVSAQKYLASPTAGLIIGRRDLVAAARAQERGIGRAMKATKEGIVGVIVAFEARERLDLGAWRARQDAKVETFVARANALPGIDAAAEQDPAGMPFSRAGLWVDPARSGLDATALAQTLRQGDPSVWVMDEAAAEGKLLLELVPLGEDEVDRILVRLAEAVS